MGEVVKFLQPVSQEQNLETPFSERPLTLADFSVRTEQGGFRGCRASFSLSAAPLAALVRDIFDKKLLPDSEQKSGGNGRIFKYSLGPESQRVIFQELCRLNRTGKLFKIEAKRAAFEKYCRYLGY